MFRQAIVRPPATNFADGLTTVQLGRPDHARALEQHAAYCEALAACGLALTRLDADERFPDSTFVEDAAVMLRGAMDQVADQAAILTRPGADSRAGEVESIAETLRELFPQTTLHSIQERGTLDGGDVCEAERETARGARSHFFIGVSERTNEAGAQQLAEIVTSYGCTASLVDLRGLPNILHLKSGLAHLGDNRLVTIDALADHAAFRGFDLVRVSASEEYAANCVRINDRVLVAAGYPKFERTLEDLGYQTVALGMSEFQKMDGGLSCLSLRF
jgi:dimethylargininase